ncbi:hypothetical protein V2J09_010232 [Rumex salicifolius]
MFFLLQINAHSSLFVPFVRPTFLSRTNPELQRSRRRNMIRYLVLILSLLFHITRSQIVPKPSASQTWKTLSGKRPLVIARGGISGVFPDSSDPAFLMVRSVSLKGTITFCDLQLTKDYIPFCLSDIKLNSGTNIANIYPDRKRTYNVNGKYVTGWFALDIMAEDLFTNVTLVQNVFSRTDLFDTVYPLVVLNDLIMSEPESLWLNVQYEKFYNHHQMSPANFLKSYPNLTKIQYISSPETGFLRSINSEIDKTKTKLIFRFLTPEEIEPTTRKLYAILLRNLKVIKEFASGILVPKEYIVPTSKDKYLQSPTTLVNDAHKLGLEVYASGFANDIPASYNYSYDPTLEYLQFVDDPKFSVDGVITDFAATASEAIACLAHTKFTCNKHPGKALIITHNGASGDYAPCTDLAYEKAVSDCADIIDCSVQMSKDGVAFCSASPDLGLSTSASITYVTQMTSYQEIQQSPGVFSFDLPWKDIQTLRPKIANFQQNLPRNPVANNRGKLMTLAEFLDFAKKKGVSGILINIENAAYLGSEKNLDIANAVASALKNATFDKQSKQTVFIQSDEKNVLGMFKNTPSYRRVYTVDKNDIDDIDEDDVKKFADTVTLPKSSLISLNNYLTSNDTHLVKRMHDANVSVHVTFLYNEFTTILFDMFSDPLLDLATFIEGLGVDGKRPLVIARGGLSGVFPDSSAFAYETATKVGLIDTVMFCDLQLTKDSIPFCLSEIRLDNTTNIALVYPKGQKTYNINGVDVTGWFALDFMAQELFPNTTSLLDDLVASNPAAIWLNVQYDTFYNQHQISPATMLERYPNITNIQYISSPEINFLKFIHPKLDKIKTKIIFKFMQPDAIEPTTKKSYSDILKDLGGIKKFASGILVPKEYIVPVGKDLYLLPSTSLVNDAHKLGIEVYAYGFANDVPTSYNYSYDPSLEYVRFVDNSQFSVDGVLSDFAGTASEAIACIAHNKNSTQPQQGKPLIISHNGASGDYAPSTDLAYDKAVDDGADIIDCSVQMSKDGVVFCSASPDLTVSTTAVTTFISQATAIPEIQQQSGVYSFNLAWSEIQTLKPLLTSFQQNMPRNPAAKNLGKLVTLAEFLDIAKKRAIPGILINIENAAYLASKKSLDITNAVALALKNTTLPKKVLIQSAESSVLAMFKDSPSYQKVYYVDKKGVTAIDEAAVKEIKKVADSVMLAKDALITVIDFFTSNDTHLVKQMHDANISVHVGVMYNEFTTIPFDMFSDPLLNLATFIKGLGVDAVVTDYPATTRNYLKSPCMDEKAEYWIQPIEIGFILTSAGQGPGSMAPQPAPTFLTVDDVMEKPIPSISTSNPSIMSDKQKSASSRIDIGVATCALSFVSILVFILCGNH